MELSPSTIVGPDLCARTNWAYRLHVAGTAFSFGRADFTFGDIISATRDAPFSTYSLSLCFYGYGLLVNDTRTDPEVRAKVFPALTDAFVAKLKSTPVAEQDERNLVTFMDNYNRARFAGHLTPEEVVQVGRIMFVLAANFSAKVNGRETADYTLPASPKGQSRDGRLPDVQVRAIYG